MVSNGAPSFVAGLNKNADCGQIIMNHGEKTENHLCFIGTGVPAATSPEFVLTDKEDDAAIYDSADPQGRKLKVKAWWDESQQALVSKLEYVKEKNHLLQVIKFSHISCVTIIGVYRFFDILLSLPVDPQDPGRGHPAAAHREPQDGRHHQGS